MPPPTPTKRNMAVSELAYTHQKATSMCMMNPGCWGTNPIPLVSKTCFLWPRRIMWFYLLLFIVVSSRWLILYRGMGLFNTVICCSVLHRFIYIYIFPLWQNYSHDFTSEKVFPSSSYPFENWTPRKNRWKNEATTVPTDQPLSRPRQGKVSGGRVPPGTPRGGGGTSTSWNMGSPSWKTLGKNEDFNQEQQEYNIYIYII